MRTIITLSLLLPYNTMPVQLASSFSVILSLISRLSNNHQPKKKLNNYKISHKDVSRLKKISKVHFTITQLLSVPCIPLHSLWQFLIILHPYLWTLCLCCQSAVSLFNFLRQNTDHYYACVTFATINIREQGKKWGICTLRVMYVRFPYDSYLTHVFHTSVCLSMPHCW